MTIGDNIKRITQEKNMSIYRVVKDSAVSMGYLYDLVNNKQRNPSIEILLKIAKALNTSIEELIKK